jgi:hypothetical protein
MMNEIFNPNEIPNPLIKPIGKLRGIEDETNTGEQKRENGNLTAKNASDERVKQTLIETREDKRLQNENEEKRIDKNLAEGKGTIIDEVV